MRVNRKYHFIGIGGIGMSALAQILHGLGCEVRGSEMAYSKTVTLLEKLGIPVFLGHNAQNISWADCVVWSSAISPANEELVQARACGMELMHRAELLAVLADMQPSVAVAGMHGKTTTTNMIFHLFRAADMDPTLISGGIDLAVGSNAHLGKGRAMVFEADESDGSLALYRPHSAVLTNLEVEHMSFYRDLQQIQSVFAAFAGHVRAPGCVAYCAEDVNLCGLAAHVPAPFVSYGTGPTARITAVRVRANPAGSCFEVCQEGDVLGDITLGVPGIHNVSNALAAITIARHWGIGFDVIRRGLEGFRGTMRRLELKAQVEGVRVMDDYAHHPTEILASLKALAQNGQGRLVVVFQPHRYSRVHGLMDDFARAFSLADEVVLTPIYSAGESNPFGISVETLAGRIRQTGHCGVRMGADFGVIATDLAGRVRPGDTVVGMGAGDIEKFAPLMKEALLAKAARPAEILQC